jgi:hypothetical protein
MHLAFAAFGECPDFLDDLLFVGTLAVSGQGLPLRKKPGHLHAVKHCVAVPINFYEKWFLLERSLEQPVQMILGIGDSGEHLAPLCF